MTVSAQISGNNDISVAVVTTPAIQVSLDVGQIGPTGPQGLTGPTGPQGVAGTGLQIDLVVATLADLPTTATVGYTVLVQSNQNVYVWSA